MINNTSKPKPYKKIALFYNKTRGYIKPINRELEFVKKQHLPATKEWPNSSYNFNRNVAKDLPVKDIMADKLIRNFFYIVKGSRYKARSRRMRNLSIKFRTNRLYISRPEIKQTNDKNAITIYNYDRERESLVKNFFYYKKLVKHSINNKLISTRKAKSLKRQSLLKRLPLTGRKLRLEIKLYEKKLFNKINNFKTDKRKDFFFKYLFIKWILSSFGYKINLFTPRSKYNIMDKFLVITTDKDISKYQQHMLINLGFIHKTNESVNKLFRQDLLRENSKQVHNYVMSPQDLSRIENKKLFFYSLLGRFIGLNGPDLSYKMNFLYKSYKAKYYKRFLKAFLLKKLRLDPIRVFYANSNRHNKYLPLLKLFLQRIYDKKIEMNLINLKYPYLNSDIFVHSLATKLRDRRHSVTAVVKNYLAMIKLIKLSLLNKSIDKYSPKYYFTGNRDNLTPKNIIGLSKIKSKWVTGVRLETAGRLTNRYVAQRSMYKYEYKGNLKSMEYRPLNIRSYIAPNLQKSYKGSKRIIGAFGIKGWISSN